MKNRIRIGTWNVWTANDEEAVENITAIMKKYKKRAPIGRYSFFNSSGVKRFLNGGYLVGHTLKRVLCTTCTNIQKIWYLVLISRRI